VSKADAIAILTAFFRNGKRTSKASWVKAEAILWDEFEGES
jgi:hypothetical protein